ncbi:MAG TPA: adenosine deaminase [Ilumatobacteraceae bacterium]|nr:adenosine deaminase [Ilumatobacteraceae bacterium]
MAQGHADLNVDPRDLRSAPKALLHDHLDGGLRPATVIELADEIGWTLPSTDEHELQAWFTAGADTGDLLQYLATFEHTLAVMQTAEHVERVAAEAVVDVAADGVVYHEVRFAPELHSALAPQEAVEAVTAGLRRGEAEAAAAGHPISAWLICCAMRTADRSLEIARLVDARRGHDDKVVAFDLAGAETGFPPSLHAEALAFARARHLNVTIHASEPPDLELIDDALVHGAHRIGHGVRLGRDTAPADDAPGGLRLGPLARYVLDRQVHLELAPTCNVQIGAVPSIAAHPIGPFLRAGFSVGVNTDNRLMSGVMPSSELVAVSTAFDLTWAEVERLAVNAVTAGFAPYEERHRIIDDVIRPAYRAARGAG